MAIRPPAPLVTSRGGAVVFEEGKCNSDKATDLKSHMGLQRKRTCKEFSKRGKGEWAESNAGQRRVDLPSCGCHGVSMMTEGEKRTGTGRRL